MELKEAIEKRRSIRKFTDYHVTDEEIKEILEAARMAPSWANTQSWSFIVLRDKNKILEITESYSKANPARNCSMNASAVIVACAKKSLSGYMRGIESTKIGNWFMFDLGLAVQNMCLRAYDLGLGTVIVGFLNHHQCRDILSIPDDFEMVVAIPIGRSEEKDRQPPARKSLETMAYLDRFGEPYIRQ